MATTDTRASTAELEFEVRDRDCFFVEVSASEQCLVELEHLAGRSDGRLLEFFAVEGAPPDRVLSLARSADGVDDVRLLDEGADGGLFEFVVSGRCVASTLADVGAVTRAVSAADGRGRVVADVPAHADVRAVVEQFRSRHGDADLVARRERDGAVPVDSRAGTRAVVGESLTDKQLEVLRTAYLHGYFGWPRERTAQECADALGISQPTFSQHVRVAQQKVFEALFEGTRPGSARDRPRTE